MEMDAARFEFPMSRHPVMCPEPGFIKMVCLSLVFLSSQPFPACLVLSAEIMQPGFVARTSNVPLPQDTVVRAANHATAEEMKKKDAEKVRKAEREKAKLDRRKRR
jgi:hypothetical protein